VLALVLGAEAVDGLMATLRGRVPTLVADDGCQTTRQRSAMKRGWTARLLSSRISGCIVLPGVLPWGANRQCSPGPSIRCRVDGPGQAVPD
jgi:hypothetical protein